MFQVERVSTNSDADLVRSAAIDATSWDPGGLDGTIATLYNNIVAGNLALPNFVTSNATFEPFAPQDSFLSTRNSKYSAVVGAFFPTLTCEEARMAEEYRGPRSNRAANFTYVSDTCSTTVQLPLVADAESNGWLNVSSSRNYMGTNQIVSCSDQAKRLLSVVTVVDANMSLLNSR